MTPPKACCRRRPCSFRRLPAAVPAALCSTHRSSREEMSSMMLRRRSETFAWTYLSVSDRRSPRGRRPRRRRTRLLVARSSRRTGMAWQHSKVAPARHADEHEAAASAQIAAATSSARLGRRTTPCTAVMVSDDEAPDLCVRWRTRTTRSARQKMTAPSGRAPHMQRERRAGSQRRGMHAHSRKQVVSNGG